MKKVLIRTLDTDVVAISVSLFGQLHLLGLWLAIQTGKHLRCLDIHKIAVLLGLEKWKCLTLFHTFNGCDQVLFFAGRGKKAAWNTWNHFGELTTSFPSMSLLRKLEDIISHSVSIERFELLPYDLKKRPAAWKYTIGVRYPHAAREKRTVPSKLQLGSVSGHELRAFWFVSLPEASEVCHKLIQCGWYKEKGCKGRCKCVKASLKCTSSLYKCGGNRERVEW